jgi:predicted nuclease of predicted toxin-antitoxin system
LNLHDLPWLADENIDPEVVRYLRSVGLDLATFGEKGVSGAPDSEVLRLAVAENRIVLTHDRDFGRLALAGGQSFIGIVFLRPGHIEPRFTIESLKVVLNERFELRSPFVLVAQRAGDDVRIRLRLHP